MSESVKIESSLSSQQLRQATTDAEHGRGDLVAQALSGLSFPQARQAMQDMRNLCKRDTETGKYVTELQVTGSESSASINVETVNNILTPIVMIDNLKGNPLSVTPSGQDMEGALTSQGMLEPDQRKLVTSELEAGHGSALKAVMQGTTDAQMDAIANDIIRQNQQDVANHLTHTELRFGLVTSPLKFENQYGDVLASVKSGFFSGKTTEVKGFEVASTVSPLNDQTIKSLTKLAESGNGKAVLDALNNRSQRESEAVLFAILDQNQSDIKLDKSVHELGSTDIDTAAGGRGFSLQLYGRSIVDVHDSYGIGYPLRSANDFSKKD